MNLEKLLPRIMAALMILSALPYFWLGDWRRGLYWTFAVGITIVVTE